MHYLAEQQRLRKGNKMEKAELMQIKTNCLHLATSLIVRDDNGEKSLTKEQVLEAAKAFFEFVK